MHRFRLACLAIVAFAMACHHRRSYDASDRHGLEHLRFSAGSALGGASGDTLLVRVLVTNDSSHVQPLTQSACGNDAVAVSARLARRLWDSSVWERPAPAPTPTYRDSTGRIAAIGAMMCSSVMMFMLPPGASTHFDRRIAVRDILGDSLQSGRYKITATLYINNREVKGLPAGEVELRVKPRSEGSTP
jgi:hypothetical protein